MPIRKKRRGISSNPQKGGKGGKRKSKLSYPSKSRAFWAVPAVVAVVIIGILVFVFLLNRQPHLTTQSPLLPKLTAEPETTSQNTDDTRCYRHQVYCTPEWNSASASFTYISPFDNDNVTAIREALFRLTIDFCNQHQAHEIPAWGLKPFDYPLTNALEAVATILEKDFQTDLVARRFVDDMRNFRAKNPDYSDPIILYQASADLVKKTGERWILSPQRIEGQSYFVPSAVAIRVGSGALAKKMLWEMKSPPTRKVTEVSAFCTTGVFYDHTQEAGTFSIAASYTDEIFYNPSGLARSTRDWILSADKSGDGFEIEETATWRIALNSDLADMGLNKNNTDLVIAKITDQRAIDSILHEMHHVWLAVGFGVDEMKDLRRSSFDEYIAHLSEIATTSIAKLRLVSLVSVACDSSPGNQHYRIAIQQILQNILLDPTHTNPEKRVQFGPQLRLVLDNTSANTIRDRATAELMRCTGKRASPFDFSLPAEHQRVEKCMSEFSIP